MDLERLRRRAREVKQHNLKLQLEHSGRAWTTAETALGFVGDVGNLARLIMMREGLRPSEDDLAARIEHELADCLWSILTLADELEVDIQQAFQRTMIDIIERDGSS